MPPISARREQPPARSRLAPAARLALRPACHLLLWMGLRASALAEPGERVSLTAIAGRYGLPPPVGTPSAVLLGNGPAGLRFEPGSRKLAVSGILIWMNASCLARGRDWTIAGCDAARIVDPLLRPRQVLASQRVRTVVLDPGHGGQDQGAAGARRVLEKKVVLDIARRVRSRLQACGVGVKLTRPKDETLALGARTAAAAAWGADVLVSIHLNSARNRDARGVETYVIASEGFASTAAARGDLRPCPGNDHEAASTVLAYFVHKGVLAQTRTPDRGIKHARFEILRSAPCPAALIECGFVSNPTDEARLIEARHRDAIAEGIARGILTYINRTGG